MRRSRRSNARCGPCVLFPVRAVRQVRHLPDAVSRAISIGCSASDGYHAVRQVPSRITVPCRIHIMHGIRWIPYGAASPRLMRVIPFKRIPSEMSNGGFLSSSALCNIRGVFASLKGGFPSSSPYLFCKVSAVNRAIAAIHFQLMNAFDNRQNTLSQTGYG